jgi:arsenite-transporting ATPase
MNIDAIIMNRILPGTVTDDYFSNWLKNQQHNFEEAAEFFNPVPILPVNLFPGEIIGYDHLRDLADQIYTGRNPLEHFYREEPYRLIKENGNYCLRLKLPFVSKEDVELNKLYEELVIRIGGFKRHILLPRQLSSLNSVSAKMEDEYLNVVFKGDEHGRKEE